MRTFRAIAWPEGKWWVVEIPELETAGQATSFADVAEAGREVVASWLDVETKDVDIEVEVRVPAEVRELWDEATALEARSRELQEQAARRRREAVSWLRGKSYTLKAASSALGISPQRLSQLQR